MHYVEDIINYKLGILHISEHFGSLYPNIRRNDEGLGTEIDILYGFLASGRRLTRLESGRNKGEDGLTEELLRDNH